MSSEECVELKNINYQTMLLNSNTQIDSNKKNSENLNDFLENASDVFDQLCVAFENLFDFLQLLYFFRK